MSSISFWLLEDGGKYVDILCAAGNVFASVTTGGSSAATDENLIVSDVPASDT